MEKYEGKHLTLSLTGLGFKNKLQDGIGLVFNSVHMPYKITILYFLNKNIFLKDSFTLYIGGPKDLLCSQVPRTNGSATYQGLQSDSISGMSNYTSFYCFKT